MLLPYLLIIAIAFLFWMIAKPEWMPSPPKNELSKKLDERVAWVKENSAGWAAKASVLTKKKKGQGALLKQWIQNEDLPQIAGLSPAQIALLEELKGWIMAKSDPEADLFTSELMTFCEKNHVDLFWLLEDKGTADMYTTLTGLVLYYGIAEKEREWAIPSSTLRAWEDAPNAKSNRNFGNKLYVKLVNKGMIKVPAEILLAPDKERLAHQVSAIKDLIAEDRATVVAISAEVLGLKPEEEPKTEVKVVKKKVVADEAVVEVAAVVEAPVVEPPAEEPITDKSKPAKKTSKKKAVVVSAAEVPPANDPPVEDTPTE